MSSKASRIPSEKDRLRKHSLNLKELEALIRLRDTARPVLPTKFSGGSPAGSTGGGTGNFLPTTGGLMTGNISFDPKLIAVDDGRVNLDPGGNPPENSTYILVAGQGTPDDIRFIDGAERNGQFLIYEGINQQVQNILNANLLSITNIVGDGSTTVTVTLSNTGTLTNGSSINVIGTDNFDINDGVVASLVADTSFTYQRTAGASTTPESNATIQDGNIITADGNTLVLDGTLSTLNVPIVTFIFDPSVSGGGVWRVVSTSSGGTGGGGPFLPTAGGSMLGPIAYDPNVSDVDSDGRIIITSSYMQSTGIGLLDDVFFFDSALFDGQQLEYQVTNGNSQVIKNAVLQDITEIVGIGGNTVQVTIPSTPALDTGDKVNIIGTTNFDINDTIITVISDTEFTYDLGATASLTPENVGLVQRGNIVMPDGQDLTLDSTLSLNGTAIAIFVFDETVPQFGWRLVSSTVSGGVNFLPISGGSMIGPIALFPQTTSLVNHRLDISSTGAFTSYVLVSGETTTDFVKFIDGTSFNGQELTFQVTLNETIVLKSATLPEIDTIQGEGSFIVRVQVVASATTDGILVGDEVDIKNTTGGIYDTVLRAIVTEITSSLIFKCNYGVATATSLQSGGNVQDGNIITDNDSNITLTGSPSAFGVPMIELIFDDLDAPVPTDGVWRNKVAIVTGTGGGLNTNLSNMTSPTIPPVDLNLNQHDLLGVTGIDLDPNADATIEGIGILDFFQADQEIQNTGDTVGVINNFGVIGGTNSGYTDGEAITLSLGTGTGATATAVIVGGVVQSVTVVSGGFGYSPGDSLLITGVTSSANNANVTVATVEDGFITLFSGLTDVLTGYIVGEDITLSGGTGGGATATAVIEAGVITGLGAIGGTNSGYTDGEPISLTGGSGTGVKATAVISGGIIQSVTIVDGGKDYAVSDSLTIKGNASGIATATITVTTVDTEIKSITLTNGGTGYTVGDQLTITGDTSTTSGAKVNVLATAQGGLLYSVADSQDHIFRVGATEVARFTDLITTFTSPVNFVVNAGGSINLNETTSGNINLLGSSTTIGNSDDYVTKFQAQIRISNIPLASIVIPPTGQTTLFVDSTDGITKVKKFGSTVVSLEGGGLETNLSNMTSPTIPTVNLNLNQNQLLGVTRIDLDPNADATIEGIGILDFFQTNQAIQNTGSTQGGVNGFGAITGTNSGYTDGESITLATVTGSGSGATATAVILGGVVQSITIVSGGGGYDIGDSLRIDGTSSNAFVTVTSLEDGFITRFGGLIDILTGYEIGGEDISLSGGTGNDATATVTIDGAGTLTSITLTNGGTGYTVGDQLTITGDTSTTSGAKVNVLATAQGGLLYSVADSQSHIFRIGANEIARFNETLTTFTGVTFTVDTTGAVNLGDQTGASGIVNLFGVATNIFTTNTSISKNVSLGSDISDTITINGSVVNFSWKIPVRVATTVAGTLTTDFENGDTIDNVVLVTGDRILIKDQATFSENGIYNVQATGSPTRSLDMAADSDAKGAALFVIEGTVNAGSGFEQTLTPAIVNTGDLTFVQFNAGGNASQWSTFTAIQTVDINANDMDNVLSITSNASDPADSGFIRMGTQEFIAWESSPAGGDLTITATTTENFQWNTTWNNIDFNSNPLINAVLGATLNANGNDLDNVNALISNASDPADSGFIRMGTQEFIAWESSPAGGDLTITATTTENFQWNTTWNNIDFNSNPLINVTSIEFDSGTFITMAANSLTLQGDSLERIVIDSGGILIESTSSVDDIVIVCADDLILRVTGTDDLIEFDDGTGTGGGRIHYAFNDDNFTPFDNIASLGEAGRRWTEVFAVNGTINTSFSEFKRDIVAQKDSDCMGICEKLEVIKFKWNVDSFDNMKEPKRTKQMNQVHFGYKADALKTMLPEAVTGNSGQEGIYEQAVIGVLIGSVKHLKASLDEALDRIKVLEAQ